MTTPDQADHWAQTATPGPWYVHTDPASTLIHDDTGHMCIAVEPAGSDYLEADLTLAAAAPDLAQTLAGMTWQHAVEVYNADAKCWIRSSEWISHREVAEQDIDAYSRAYGGAPTHLVRRLVGPVEVVE